MITPDSAVTSISAGTSKQLRDRLMTEHALCIVSRTGRYRLRPVHANNNVEATFDFVAKKGNKVERVYRKISSFRQSRMLLRHC